MMAKMESEADAIEQKVILKKYDRSISFHREFVFLGAGVTGALLLSQAVFWSGKAKKGWFWKSVKEWTDETGLTRHEQETARQKLRNLGVLEEMKRGVPCRSWFRVNAKVLDQLVEKAIIENIMKSTDSRNPAN